MGYLVSGIEIHYFVNRIVAVILACIFALSLAGCAGEKKQSEEKDDKAMRLTKEYALEHSALDASDLENVDFEAFVDYYELTNADLDNYDLRALLKMYLEELEIGPMEDYTEIYLSADGVMAEPDLEHVSQMIWDLHDGDYNTCMVIDMEKRAVYYGEGDFLDACGEEHKVRELSDEDIAFVKQSLIESGITGWQNSYVGTSEGTTGHFAWSIGFRLDDGRCVAYSGSGVMNSGTPLEMYSLLNELTDHFSA